MSARTKRPYGKPVEVFWTDALNLPPEWSRPKAACRSRPAASLSVGYVLKETAEFITIAALTNANHVSNGITIPKSCIQRIRRCR